MKLPTNLDLVAFEKTSCQSSHTILMACLVARKWAEVRKWGSIIAHFPIYPNTGKGK